MLHSADDWLDCVLMNRSLMVMHRLDVALVVVVVVEDAVGLVLHLVAAAQVKWRVLRSMLAEDFVTGGHLVGDTSPVTVVFMMH